MLLDVKVMISCRKHVCEGIGQIDGRESHEQGFLHSAVNVRNMMLQTLLDQCNAEAKFSGHGLAYSSTAAIGPRRIRTSLANNVVQFTKTSESLLSLPMRWQDAHELPCVWFLRSIVSSKVKVVRGGEIVIEIVALCQT